MFTPTPRLPPRVPRRIIVVIGLGAVFALTAFGIRRRCARRRRPAATRRCTPNCRQRAARHELATVSLARQQSG